MEENRYTFTIEEKQGAQRLDAVLATLVEEASRSYLQKLIETGCVSVNGKTEVSKKRKISAGDVVSLEMQEPEGLSAEPENIPLSIIYEDDDLLIVNKPKGLVVHPAAGTPSGTLVNAVLYHCGDRLSSINGIIRPGIVHRIDKDTSGLLMVAKNDAAHRCLAKQLAEHSITRAYRALVYNNFTEDEGTITGDIGRDPKNRLRMAVVERGGKPAVTHYTVLERFGRYTYLEVRLETGRTHHIRVHMASVCHPLVGDAVYGPKKRGLGAESQMLHAKTLGFIHPSTGEYMEFDSPLPAEFELMLEKLRK